MSIQSGWHEMSREALREEAGRRISTGSFDAATALATLAITAPSEKLIIAPQVYRGLEPERVSAARGDAAMAKGQDLLDADAAARHGLSTEHAE